MHHQIAQITLLGQSNIPFGWIALAICILGLAFFIMWSMGRGHEAEASLVDEKLVARMILATQQAGQHRAAGANKDEPLKFVCWIAGEHNSESTDRLWARITISKRANAVTLCYGKDSGSAANVRWLKRLSALFTKEGWLTLVMHDYVLPMPNECVALPDLPKDEHSRKRPATPVKV